MRWAACGVTLVLLALCGCNREPHPKAAENSYGQSHDSLHPPNNRPIAVSEAQKGELAATPPSQCILDELKHTDKNAAMIRWNCVHRYIEARLPHARRWVGDIFNNSSIRWYADVPAFPSPISQHAVLTILNTLQHDQIIAADFAISSSTTKSVKTYRAYADFPIDSGTVGTLSAQTIEDSSSTARFWKTHTWVLLAVYSVPDGSP